MKRKSLFGLVLVSALLMGAESSCESTGEEKVDSVASDAPTAKTQPATKTPAAAVTGPRLTSQQQHAAKSAEQYLSMQGFSRLGLIAQLSSTAGDGYSKRDAGTAVDSLHIDWNAQAVRSAKAYLDLQSFSCRGLIEQLSSSSGDQYTRSQAEYGARHTDAC